MLLSELEDMENVVFIKNNTIPLGMNSYKGFSKEKIIYMPYQKFSGSWLLIGRPGSGKSTLLKRILSYVLGFYKGSYRRMGFNNRPTVIFDMQSEDHHLIRFPNSQPTNLFYNQGERTFGLEDVKCYVPNYVREEMLPFDEVFGFSPDVYSIRDWISIGMGAGAAKKLHHLIKMNPDSTLSISKLSEALEELPTNLTELKRLGDGFMFKMENFINYSSKQSMVDNFTIAYDDKVFCDRGGKYYKESMIREIKKQICVVNFHQAEQYYPLTAGKILGDVYKARRRSYRNMSMDFPPPVVVIEEAEKLVTEDLSDNSGSIYWLGEILKRGRKYDFFTIIATQEAHKIHNTIRGNSRHWIIGKVKDEDLAVIPRNVVPVVQSLNAEAHEFCIVFENGNYDTFYAWDSPLELNRETRFVAAGGHKDIS